jgi:hypothetical protein
MSDELNIDNFSSINNMTPDSPKYLENQKSPINMAGSAKPVSEINVNPINLDQPQKFDSTNLTNSDATVTSNSGELAQDLILSEDKSISPININLETNQSDVFKPILSNDQPAINNTSITNNNSNLTTNNKVDGSTQYSNVETSSNQPTASSINESKKEKDKSKFLSKIGKIANAAGEVLNLPSIKDLGKSAGGLFGVTGENVKSKVSEITKSFSNNSINSIDSKVESQTSSNNSNTTSTNEKVGTTSNNSEVTSVSQSNMQVEQSKPSVSNKIESKAETQNSTQNTNNSPTILNNQSQPISSAQTSNTVSNNYQTSQPNTTENTPQPINVNVDINQLAQSITRLERILLSGIEVTLKEI